jgi:hypothetical protein
VLPAGKWGIADHGPEITLLSSTRQRQADILGGVACANLREPAVVELEGYDRLARTLVKARLRVVRYAPETSTCF